MTMKMEMIIHRNSSPPVDDIELATEADTHCSVGIASHLSTNILNLKVFCCGMCANNMSNESPAQPQPEQVQRHGQEVQLCPDRPPSSTPPVGQQQLNVILKKDIIVDLVNGQFDIWCILHLDLTRRASRWPRAPDEVGVEDGAEDLDIMYLIY